MNVLLESNFQYENKKILFGKKIHEIFFSKKTNPEAMRQRISFAFPGYPETKNLDLQRDSEINSEGKQGLFQLNFIANKSFSPKKSDSLFFSNVPEHFFVILKGQENEIKEECKINKIKNPYALFTFKSFMTGRFKDFRKEFLISKKSKRFGKSSSFSEFILSSFKDFRKKTIKTTQEKRFGIKIQNGFFLTVLVFFTVNFSKFLVVNVWNILLPFLFSKFVFYNIFRLRKKTEELFNSSKLGKKLEGLYNKFLVLEIFLNGLFRTSNILSV